MAVALGLVCAASRPVSAQGLPLAWAWAQDEAHLILSVEALDELSDVELSVRRHTDSRVFPFDVGSLRMSEQRDFTLPRPTRSTEYSVVIRGRCGDLAGVVEDGFSVEVLAELDFSVDVSSFDVAGRSFVMTMTQPAAHVELLVRGDTGAVLAEQRVEFEGEAAGTPLAVAWTQLAGNVLAIDVKAVGSSGAWASRQYVPWSAEFDAAHVNFASGSAEIPESDLAMLRERLRSIAATADRVGEWVEVSLYVGGYTDTVGSSSDNQRLSEARARSIARFFRSEGAAFSIYYQGFGESGLALPTGDNVDAMENRRSIFILGHREPPLSSTIPRANWVRLD